MIEEVALQNGVRFPMLGFGTYKLAFNREDMNRAIRNGLDAGYRGIDTAAHYGCEEMVGEAIRASGYKRDELFLTTKIWNTDHGYQRTLEAFAESEKRLGTYIDMLLIHWPCPMKGLYQDTWRALQELYETERVKAIGVSNFTISHLEALRALGGVQPMVNQIEMHPGFIQEDMLSYCREHEIVAAAWSPFLRGKNIAEQEDIRHIAEHHKKTAAQVVLRYLTQLGAAVMVKTASYEHAKANGKIFDFRLNEEEMETMKKLNTGERVYQDPDLYYL